jgi:hypothetical protein
MATASAVAVVESASGSVPDARSRVNMAVTVDCGEMTVARGATERVAYTASAAELAFASASTTSHWAAVNGLLDVKGIQWPSTYSVMALVGDVEGPAPCPAADAAVPHAAAAPASAGSNPRRPAR